MIMRKQAHKDTDNPPGQYVSDFDRYSNIMPRKLSDIIDRVNKHESVKQYKYKDFYDWCSKQGYYIPSTFIKAFNAAREKV